MYYLHQRLTCLISLLSNSDFLGEAPNANVIRSFVIGDPIDFQLTNTVLSNNLIASAHSKLKKILLQHTLKRTWPLM